MLKNILNTKIKHNFVLNNAYIIYKYSSLPTLTNWKGHNVLKNELEEKIKNKNDKFLLLDVRGDKEYKEGFIGDAKNLPLPNIFESLDLNEKEFKQLYNFDKIVDVEFVHGMQLDYY
eukprot:TRINITY_DN10365_c0_g1_i2.p1 TRINITY_DN10365_c0_g1~~TRINITY_DN10365_c0_g1_i2.p1  ORF type:complete len:117 (+),score=12.59 TRINITY_DN10365_c0_g1_i2:65-415(+)